MNLIGNVFYKYGKGVFSKMKTIKVERLNNIDPTKYREGDLFLTDRSVAILHNGKVETLVKQADVRKIVRDEVKKVLKDEK